MAGKNNIDVKPSELEFVISRVFDAPRELVFKAWTEPRHVSQWWGPRTFTNSVCEMDLRVGGAYRFAMRSPEGVEYPVKGIFREIVRPERIVMTQDCSEHPAEWHDMVNPNRAKGDLNPAGQLLTTVTFESQGGKTKLTVRTLFGSAAIRNAMVKMGMNEGWSQSLERLAEELGRMSKPLDDAAIAGKHGLTKPEPFVIERTFDAPVTAIWKAITDKAAMRQWFFDIKDFEPKVGFQFRFDVQHEGFHYSHRCVVKAVEPNKKFAYTWRYEGYEGDSLVTIELFAAGNKTRVKLTHEGLETFPKLPAFVKSNFEKGWTSLIGSSLKDFVEGK